MGKIKVLKIEIPEIIILKDDEREKELLKEIKNLRRKISNG